MTYKEARVYLDEMSKYGSVLGLDTIRGLLRELGNPQESLKFIHIAGTNGKGSVLAYTSTILSEAGYRIGRYVSPTVISYLERIQMNGRWISEEEFAELTEKVKEAIARLKAAGENLPTVFETETAIAFLYFRKMNCDFVVLETGLGGELDATNIVKNTVCAVFATISRDHLGVIGNTLEEIAQTKAGIIKNGCAVVSAQQKEAVSEILKKRAEASDCSYREADLSRFLVEKEDYHGIRFSYKEYKNLRGSLAGECQIANLATALEVIRTLNVLGISVPETAVRKGLEETRWPGRFTLLMEQPVFLVDGAHNEDAAQKLRMSMERYFPGRRLILILGVFKDKEYEKIASILEGASISYIKWDMNRSLSDVWSRGVSARQQGEVFHRYILGVYQMYERLTTRFPDILFESCASGGARFDAGMLYYAPQGWLSDNTDAIERLRIQYGTSYGYPISSMGSHVSASPNHQLHRQTPLWTRANTAFFGTFGYELDLAQLGEDELSELKIQTAFMKQHRSLIQYGTFYRLSSPFENNITAWMVVSEDRTEALVGWYRTLNVANGPFTRLYLQGLEESDLYNVTEYTEGHESAVSTHYGDELMNLGLITSDASSGQYMDGRRESCDFDSRLFYVQKQAE